MDLVKKLETQRTYFISRATQSYDFRIAQLKNLKNAVIEAELEVYDALFADLHKSKEESWITENGFFLSEINHTIKKLASWMKPKTVGTNLANLPGSSKILSEPLGVVLIIGPWNYPFHLLFAPLIGAIAAGNCVVLKSSEFAPATSQVMKKIIQKTFKDEYVLFVEGDGAEIIGQMMDNFVFDHVFYTGSTAVGKIIYQSAAKKLTPVTLELGGKSPCVVEADADIKVAAKRIAFPKFSNAGQMCVAPDYVLVHKSQKNALIKALIKSIQQFFGDKPEDSNDYGRIINQKQFDRLTEYLKEGSIIYGGKFNRENKFIEPTLLDNISLEDAVMQSEIFGPILPIISFETEAEAVAIINRHKNPLAFYIFTSSTTKANEWIQKVPAGGCCVNNASVHLINHQLPFGGRGASGVGNYHGKFSFDTFSHKKSILNSATWIDPKIKYPPYAGKLSLLKKLI